MVFASLNEQIQNILTRQSGRFETGIYIENANTGQVLFDKNGNQPMLPASNTKVMTAAAADLYLGPEFQYFTRISTDGKISGATLDGNLYVTFSGDPTLSSSDLNTLIKNLRVRGIRTIQGKLVIDETVFSGPYYGLGWPIDDFAYCYAAPVAGSIINGNCMAVQVMRAKNAHVPNVRQFTTHFPVINNLRLVGAKALRTCVFQPMITDRNAILLQGCLPTKMNWGFSFAIRNPQSYAKEVILAALSQAGVSLQGKVVFNKTPPHTTLLASLASEHLQSLLAYMLKRSDNVYAGAITKTLGLEYYGVGSYKAGANAISAILVSRIGNGFKPPYLEDGSGMSVYNLIAPIQLVQVYHYMHSDPRLAALFMQSLAVSGQKGTLAYRMTGNNLASHVFGKTGTINGVSTLSGYLALPGKPVIIFAIMMNGIIGSAASARAVQDQIVQAIAKNL